MEVKPPRLAGVPTQISWPRRKPKNRGVEVLERRIFIQSGE
jgi:hypothetical protein